jgi:protein required for attachment to host cells
MVAVMDGAKARLFVVEMDDEVVGRPRRSHLVEIEDLISPGHRARDRDHFTDSRPGSRRGGTHASSGHAVDDHRTSHRDNADRQFVAEVLSEIGRQATQRERGTLILAAEPGVLGVVRDERHRLGEIEVIELPKHLTALTTPELHKRLLAEELLRH